MWNTQEDGLSSQSSFTRAPSPSLSVEIASSLIVCCQLLVMVMLTRVNTVIDNNYISFLTVTLTATLTARVNQDK